MLHFCERHYEIQELDFPDTDIFHGIEMLIMQKKSQWYRYWNSINNNHHGGRLLQN